jgi:hypothetical protein
VRKLVLVLAILAMAPVNGRATPMDEATRKQFVGGAMKDCLDETNKSEFVKRMWSQSDISNYCGCYSVSVSNIVTQEDLHYIMANHNQFPPGYIDRVINPTAEYCYKKYLPQPDVSDVLKKKW